jgi:hypothetical protein
MLPKTTPLPSNHSNSISQLMSKHLLWCGDPAASQESLQSYSPPLSNNTPPIPLISVTHNATNKNLQLSSTISLKRGAIHEFFYNDSLQPKAISVSLASIIAINAHLSLSQNSYRDKSRRIYNNPQTKLLPTSYHSIIWIGKRCWPAPFTLDALTPFNSPYRDLNGTLKSSLFIDTASDKETLWAIENALTNRSIQLVIADCPNISPSTSQRLALLADKNKHTAILLRAIGDLNSRSFAHSRWELTPTPSHLSSPSWLLTLRRVKSGAISCDNRDYAAILSLTENKKWRISLGEHVLGLPCKETPLICSDVAIDAQHAVIKRATG